MRTKAGCQSGAAFLDFAGPHPDRTGLGRPTGASAADRGVRPTSGIGVVKFYLRHLTSIYRAGRIAQTKSPAMVGMQNGRTAKVT